MHIVINISEKVYKRMKLLSTLSSDNECLKYILDGIPLPRGCGRLIILSEDIVKREQVPLSFSCQKWISEVGLSNATVAIIDVEKSKEVEG